MLLHVKRAKHTKRRRKQRSRRTQKLRRRVSPLKAPAIIPMRPSLCVYPTEPFVATNKTENKSRHSPISPAYISVPPNTITRLHSISRNGGRSEERRVGKAGR